MTTQHSHYPQPSGSPALSIDRPGDALALVRHTFGQLPEDSLVLIGLHSGTTGGHLRMDLSTALMTPQSAAQAAADWLAGPETEPVPQAVLSLIFSGEAASGPKLQGAGLVDELRNRLDLQYRCPLVKTWYIGTGYVRDFDCHDGQCCPFPGVSAEEELQQALQRAPHLESLPRPTPAAQTIETFLQVPLPPDAPTPAQVSAVRRLALPPGHSHSALQLWEASIREIIETGGCEAVKDTHHTAELLRSAEEPSFVEALVPLAAIDLTTAQAGLTDSTPLSPTAADRPTRLELRPQQYVSAVTGRLEGAPVWSKIEALDALLHLLMPYPGTHRWNLLALKGWIEWAKGCGSSATIAVETCLKHQPQHLLAGFLAELFESTGPCPWARTKLFSHGWWRSQQPM